MKVELVVGDIVKHKADMVVVNLFEGVRKPGGATGAVDAATGGAISAAIRDGDFRGKWGETLYLRPGKGVASPRVLVIGLGKKEKFTLDRVRQSALPVMRVAKKLKVKSVASVIHGAGAGGLDPEKAARFAGLGAVLSHYEYDRYKSEKGSRVVRFRWLARNGEVAGRIRKGLAHGARLGEAINWGRELVASPPGDLRPDGLARAAKAIAGGKIRIKVYGRKEAEAWKMGGLLAVGKGSEISPRLIVAEYRGGRPGAPWTALVGKGVTFDTGGISLKKWEGMEKMKYDMAGGAGMLATGCTRDTKERRGDRPCRREHAVRGRLPARRRAPDDVGQDGGGALHRRRGEVDPGGFHNLRHKAIPPGRHPRRRHAYRFVRGGAGKRHDGHDGKR
jgi:leucyl aminopeptidase